MQVPSFSMCDHQGMPEEQHLLRCDGKAAESTIGAEYEDGGR